MVGGANSSQVSWAKERYSRTSFQVFPLHDLKISNPHLKMFKVTRGRGRPRTARIEASWRRNTPRKPRASQVIAVDAVKEVLPQRKVKQRAARTQIAFKDGRAHLRATATRVAASAALTRSAVRHRTRVLSSDALVPIPKSRRNALRAKAHFSRTIPAALKDQDHFQSLTHVFAPVNSSRTHWVLVVLLVKQRIIR
eukprot:m.266416 g.266416  ORF g.266416 m.266416 type:complete len:196 (+) comp15630_c0_seq14:957-1544(+)